MATEKENNVKEKDVKEKKDSKKTELVKVEKSNHFKPGVCSVRGFFQDAQLANEFKDNKKVMTTPEIESRLKKLNWIK